MCLFLFPHYYSRHLAKMIRSMKSQHHKCLPWYSISRGFHVYFLIQGDSQDADTQMTNGWAKPWYELLFRIWPDLCWYFKPNPRAAAIFCWGPFLTDGNSSSHFEIVLWKIHQLWSECFLLKFTYWNPNPQGDRIRKWVLWEMIRS